jgi:MraZ protein
MFIGEYTHNLDEKGRLAIPVKFRNLLANGAVVTKGLDNCLSLYPQSAWDKQVEKLEQLPLTQAKSRAYARFILAGAFGVEIDKLEESMFRQICDNSQALKAKQL